MQNKNNMNEQVVKNVESLLLDGNKVNQKDETISSLGERWNQEL